MLQKEKMTDAEMIECPEDGKQLERLRAIMHRLRSPGGCPWDAEQTHQSLVPHMIEETYETVDTIQREDWEHLKEELGDLLLQVVFHSEIAEGDGRFNLDDVARGISDKLVRRHPHVYGDSQVDGADGVLSQWDEIKRQEKGAEEKPYLHGVGKGLPGMLKAAKLQKKVSKVGFDWPDARSILDKVREELDEVEEAFDSYQEGGEVPDALQAEIGDLLFVVVNVARKLGVNPEVAIERTNLKFEERFQRLETSLRERGISLAEATSEEMEREWVNAKAHDRR
ncbi:nucleoside triphosphate pyrophosphohydrolase [Rubritalea halochordaticola]|uniref:Nucleoside triphosphate pyrophosphohydrolase n=1 Tax=Rubritalea halochordaticola TaxID=714537 RepID=A0ABP9UYG4_9BACT